MCIGRGDVNSCICCMRRISWWVVYFVGRLYSSLFVQTPTPYRLKQWYREGLVLLPCLELDMASRRARAKYHSSCFSPEETVSEPMGAHCWTIFFVELAVPHIWHCPVGLYSMTNLACPEKQHQPEVERIISGVNVLVLLYSRVTLVSLRHRNTRDDLGRYDRQGFELYVIAKFIAPPWCPWTVSLSLGEVQ